jgi:ABC-type uncharacterized transport system substrate-binding protein
MVNVHESDYEQYNEYSFHFGLSLRLQLRDQQREMYRTIIALVDRYRLPTMYYFPFFARDGGLISYGPDEADMFRQAAGYVDRILKGAKATDLPVQQPTKYELVINLKTAKALGLTIPEPFLQTADEVIE